MHPVTKARNLARAAAEIGIGVGAAYLLDPNLGAERRLRLFRAAANAAKRSCPPRLKALSTVLSDAGDQREAHGEPERELHPRHTATEPALRVAPRPAQRASAG